MGRLLLLPAVNNAETEDALFWLLENLYKEGDTVHVLSIVPYVGELFMGLFHVLARLRMQASSPSTQICTSSVQWYHAPSKCR